MEEKRSRFGQCANREAKSPNKYLEWKAEFAVRGENAAQKKKTIETENDVEIKDCEKGSSEIALYESQRELESQRMQLHQPNQWPDQAQREKINLR